MVSLNGEGLTLEAVVKVSREYGPVTLSPSAVEKMQTSRRLVDELGKRGGKSYGITTGIGELADVSVPEPDLRRLQLNILRSHAAGVGDPVDEDLLRAMMLLRANGLAKGHSGVRPEVVQLLADLLNRRVHPVVPRKGSVGASGDLAPLAHMSLVLVGEGEADLQDERLPGAAALEKAGLEPLELLAKEGLALVNGTSLTAAYGCLAWHDALRLLKEALVAGALSFEALRGRPESLDARIHDLRPHSGQKAIASGLRRLLEGSEILARAEQVPKVQDAYTLRCMPQVLGACLESLGYARRVLAVELNSATDNPLLFPDEGEALSGGNFHGQPLAFVLDFMAIVIAAAGAYAERRIARLLDGHLSGLPPFLTEESGLNSGLMLAQYTAAALASENKVLAHPASVDSIPTSANQEDFVCNGPAAGEKLFRIIENVRRIVGIEYLCASQGLEFVRPGRAGKGTQRAYEIVRKRVPPLKEDRPVSGDLEELDAMVQGGDIVHGVERVIGTLEFSQ